MRDASGDVITGGDSARCELVTVDLHVLAAVTAQMSSAVLIADASGRTTWVNDAFVVLCGYTVDEARGRSPGSMLGGLEPDPAVAVTMSDAVRSRETYSARLVHHRRSGEGRWVEIEAEPIRDVDGRVRHIMVVLRDVTAWKRAEREIQEGRDFLQMVINAVADPIFVKDEQHRFVLRNDACGGLGGRPEVDRLGKSDQGFVRKDEADIFEAEDALTLASGKVRENEEHLTTAAGQVRTLLTKKTPLTL
jgi:PAS domain S-box-containing protein